MSLIQKIKLGVVLSLIVVLTCAIHAHAANYSDEKVYNYLKAIQSETTGLLPSFIGSKDRALENQASLYDQGLAGLVFIQHGDMASAERILEFFEKKWQGRGFSNFYNSLTGDVGIEEMVNLGPNAWISILALHYCHVTKDSKYLGLAMDIVRWTTQLNKRNGGFAMGDRSYFKIDWRYVFSSENNLSAYGALHLLEPLLQNETQVNVIKEHKRMIRKFLRDITFDDKSTVKVGLGNSVTASDIISFGILALHPEEFPADVNISTKQLLNIADRHFYISADGMRGYDFTDAFNARKIPRRRMISLEWTAMYGLAYLKLAGFHRQKYFQNLSGKEKVLVDKYLKRAKEIESNLDRKIINMNEAQIAYPYATKGFTRVFPFSSWWSTPRSGRGGKPTASLSSTCWRYFLSKKFNPFQYKNDIPVDL